MPSQNNCFVPPVSTKWDDCRILNLRITLIIFCSNTEISHSGICESVSFCTALPYQKSSLLGNEDCEQDLCFVLVASPVLSNYVFSLSSLLGCFQVEERAETKNMRENLIMYGEEEEVVILFTEMLRALLLKLYIPFEVLIVLAKHSLLFACTDLKGGAWSH